MHAKAPTTHKVYKRVPPGGNAATPMTHLLGQAVGSCDDLNNDAPHHKARLIVTGGCTDTGAVACRGTVTQVT